MEATLSTQLSQAHLANQVGTAVLAKSLGDLRQNGQDLARLMSTAALPQVVKDPLMGQNINTLA